MKMMHNRGGRAWMRLGERVLALLLVTVMLVGCGSSDHMVKAAMPKEDASNEANLKAWVEKGKALSTQEFEKKTIAEYLVGDENAVYSPINAYIALAMLVEACDDETKDELLALLGTQDTAALRQKAQAMFNANYLDQENATKIANSVWLNDQVKFRRELLETYANEYYASTFFGKMGTEEMDQLLRDWINENTGNLLKDEAESIETTPDTLIEFLSTIYFQAQWAERNKFIEALTQQRGFSGKNGMEDVSMMRTSFEGEVYETSEFAECELELSQGKMCFFKPKAGVTIDDILKGDQLCNALHRRDQGVTPAGRSQFYDIVNFMVPKFEIHGTIDMIEGLQKLGVNRVFSPDTAQMQSQFDKAETVEHLPYVSKIQHNATVKIDEKGVVAAAYTEISGTEGAAPVEELTMYDFILNEPFIYAILGEDGTVLFVGTVHSIKK